MEIYSWSISFEQACVSEQSFCILISHEQQGRINHIHVADVANTTDTTLNVCKLSGEIGISRSGNVIVYMYRTE
jgi:hypothetical protein